jgi:hypothetical protein
MTSEEFAARAAEVDAEDEPALDALTGEYLDDAKRSAGMVVACVQPRDAALAAKALSFLGLLEEAAVTPLLERAGQDSPIQQWMLLEAARGVRAADLAVTARLKSMLRDGRPVAAGDVWEAAEEKLPPFRVCDEAYLALRRILHPEPSLQFDLENRHFLDLPDSRKDREIHNFETTGTFTEFLPDAPGGEA